MNILVVRSIKNFGFLILKIALIVFLGCFIFNIGKTFYTNLIDDYSNYLFVRGFENYGIETVAKQKDENIYTYIVNDEEYFYIRDNVSSESIDKTVNIYYDSLSPEIVIETYQLSEIDSFHSDTFRVVMNCYLMALFCVFVFSLLWFLLDKLKYNKIIWKQCV